MELDRINDLFKERYIITLDIIEKIHKKIANGEYREVIDDGKKLAPHILNKEIVKLEI